ncbi:anti-sigma factor family protein, partial [Ralstonia solanacearum]
MSAAPIHIEELHAYVDGRLPAVRRAAVEAYLAAHPAAAAEVAAWRRIDGRLHRALDPLLNEPVPQRRIPSAILAAAQRPQASGKAGAIRGWGALALGIGCLAVGIGAGWMGRGTLEPSLPMQRFANDALVSHVVYAPESKHMVEVPAAEEAHLVTWLSRR